MAEGVKQELDDRLVAGEEEAVWIDKPSRDLVMMEIEEIMSETRREYKIMEYIFKHSKY